LNQPAYILVMMTALIISIAIHEFAHAFVASRLGDDLPEREGRLTLNPLAHADPLGTLLLPFLGMLMSWGFFGWGKPVRTIPTNYTRRMSMRAGSALVAIAGPLSNLLLAIIAVFAMGGLWSAGLIGPGSPFLALLDAVFKLNIFLFMFNLLPLPPFDGGYVVSWLFGARADGFVRAVENAGMFGLMIAVLVGSRLIGPPARALIDGLSSASRAVF